MVFTGILMVPLQRWSAACTVQNRIILAKVTGTEADKEYHKVYRFNA